MTADFIEPAEFCTIGGVIKVILALIILVNGFFAYRLVVDLIRHKSEVWKEPGSNLLCGAGDRLPVLEHLRSLRLCLQHRGLPPDQDRRG